MPGTGRGIRRYTCARRWIYTCVYIAATRKWDCGDATREKERRRAAGRERRAKRRWRKSRGETRVKDEDTGVARASLARILISSTAHQPLAESRSFAYFISRSAKRGVSWHGMAHLRTRLRRIGRLQSSIFLRPPRRPPSCISSARSSHSSLLARLSRKMDASIIECHEIKR